MHDKSQFHLQLSLTIISVLMHISYRSCLTPSCMSRTCLSNFVDIPDELGCIGTTALLSAIVPVESSASDTREL